MTDGYQVIIEKIRQASRAAMDAAEIAGKVDLAGALGPVGQALPGSRTAQSAGRLAPVWTHQVSRWSADAKAYADNLATAVDRYAANEDQAAADFRFGRRGGTQAA